MTLDRLRILGAAGVLVLLLAAPFVSSGFLLFQLTLVLTYAIAVLGVNLMLGFSGLVSLAQGAFFAVGAYACSMLMTQQAVPYPLAILAGAVIAGLVGVVVGLPALRLPGLQLAILTFGLAGLVPQLIVKFTDYTRGVSGITLVKPTPPAWFPAGTDHWFYAVSLAAFLLYCAVAHRLLSGDTGRTIRALRDGPLVASALGIDATRVRLSVFAISSGFAGLAGGLFAVANAYVNPDSFQALKSIEFIIAAVVGGLTSITGALIGAAFIVFVPEWAGSANVALGALLYGVILILVVVLAPRGVVGLAEGLATRLLGRQTAVVAKANPSVGGPPLTAPALPK